MDAPPHVRRVLDRLDGIAPEGPGWRARCPAHNDGNPSLSIALGDDNRVLVTCHAGCAFPAIVKAIGLEQRDFFAPNGRNNGRPGPRAGTPQVFAQLDDALKAACPRGHKLVATWVYATASGEHVLHVCRFEPTAPPPNGEKPDKTFRPISRAGDGFVIKDPSGPLPLYRLPDIIAAPRDSTICVSEGEKAADALAALGLVATTTAHGAKSPKRTDLSPLAGRDVVILTDNDAAGEKFGTQLGDLLLRRDPPARVKIVRLPDLPPKGDAVEFIASKRAQGLADDSIRRDIEEIALGAPDYKPPTAAVIHRLSSPADRRPLTDTGNAERYVDRCHADVRHVGPWKKWLVWDGRRWRLDDVGLAMARTKDVVRSIYAEAAHANDSDVRKAIGSWAKRSEAKDRRRAMLDLAAVEEAIAITHEILDADPWLLNVKNGTIDLRTGKPRPHRREDMITRFAPVEFDVGAVCPAWDSFLERILPDEQVRGFLQRVAGMCLTGDATFQGVIFFFGTGANGKTVFLRTMQGLLGPYSVQCNPDLLLEMKNRGHPTELATLFRARLAIATEFGAGRAFDEVRLKQLTGNDLINARRMREDEWSFVPTHKLVIAGNHRPRIKGTDEGIWRRINLVPFTVMIQKKERDERLIEKLVAEFPGILNWALDGCLLWQRGGLESPECVVAATTAYREEMDILADFLADKCVVNADARVSAKDLYCAYKTWCERTGDEPLSLRTFGLRMTERGVAKRKSNGVYVYLGLGIRSDAPA